MSGAAVALLSRAALLAVVDIRTEDVQVPEWGGAVRVKTMSGTEREAFSQHLAQAKASFTATLLVHTVVDAEGAPLFTVDDIAALSAKSATALERVGRVASRLNGLDADAVEGAEKN